jgi:hypothetical protein
LAEWAILYLKMAEFSVFFFQNDLNRPPEALLAGPGVVFDKKDAIF